jgi:vWA domain found in the FtsH ternary systems
VKFLRDELLYYSRDENQFLRRRRTFAIVLDPSLVYARFKDAELPTQRIVLTLAVLVAAVRKLTEWLSEDALRFEFLVVGEAGANPLAQEAALLTTIFREQITNGTVRVEAVPDLAAAEAVCAERARRSLCHVLGVGSAIVVLTPKDAEAASLTIAGSRPALATADGTPPGEADDAFDAWTGALERLVEAWV